MTKLIIPFTITRRCLEKGFEKGFTTKANLIDLKQTESQHQLKSQLMSRDETMSDANFTKVVRNN